MQWNIFLSGAARMGATAAKLNLFLAAGLTLTACAHGTARGKDVVSAQVQKPVAFTNNAKTDSFIVWLRNAGDARGRADFVINDSAGRRVFNDSVALSSLDVENPIDVWTPEAAMERLDPTTSNLSDLKPAIVSPDDAGPGTFWPVEKEEASLERAEATDRPVLCYVNSPSALLCAWFDDASKRGIVLLEGSK